MHSKHQTPQDEAIDLIIDGRARLAHLRRRVQKRIARLLLKRGQGQGEGEERGEQEAAGVWREQKLVMQGGGGAFLELQGNEVRPSVLPSLVSRPPTHTETQLPPKT